MNNSDIENIYNNYPKAITGFAFRNGIIEDYHAQGCLNNAQMKCLNKFMVDKLGILLKLYLEERYYDIDLLLGFHFNTTKHWDNPNIEEEEKELSLIKDLLKL